MDIVLCTGSSYHLSLVTFFLSLSEKGESKLCSLQGIGYIACMRSLKRLTFVDCNAFTNAGIEKLAPLTNLQELSFIRCTRISEKGMDFLQKLLKLRSLTIFMCTKVGHPSALEIVHRRTKRLPSRHRATSSDMLRWTSSQAS